MATFKIGEAISNPGTVPGKDSGASDSNSTDITNDKSGTSESVLPVTGDATFIAVALIGVAAIVASILGFIALRKRE